MALTSPHRPATASPSESEGEDGDVGGYLGIESGGPGLATIPASRPGPRSHGVGMATVHRENVTGCGQRVVVVVVEGNVEIGRFATQILQDFGYRSHWASNADEALACLAQGTPDFDVVFSDVVIPGTNGVNLAR